MDLWNALKEWAIPSETVRTYLEKIGWEPTARQLTSIFCSRKLQPAEQEEFLSHLDTTGDETLTAQIQTLLKRPADMDKEPAHFIHDPPVSETISFPFHVGDIVWCLGAEGKRALYLGQEYGLVVPAGEDRHKSSWTAFPGQDGERLGVEFLNEQGDFTRLKISPWELERATQSDLEQTSWRYLKQGSELLLGKGSFCEFLSAREVFCREFPKIRATMHDEIEAVLRKSEREIESGKLDLDKKSMSFEEFKRRLEERWKNCGICRASQEVGDGRKEQ